MIIQFLEPTRYRCRTGRIADVRDRTREPGLDRGGERSLPGAEVRFCCAGTINGHIADTRLPDYNTSHAADRPRQPDPLSRLFRAPAALGCRGRDPRADRRALSVLLHRAAGLSAGRDGTGDVHPRAL